MYNCFMEKTAPAITIHIELNREAIRKTLADRAGEAPDAYAVAEAAIGIWLQMSGLLAPVIGAQGVEVLFRRSLRLTGNAFPWLAITGDSQDSSALLANIQARLAGRAVIEATEGGYTLLVTFVELLTSLIGEPLTGRMLKPVWVSRSQSSEPEKNHE